MTSYDAVEHNPRITSGHARIDEVFGGGLPANSVTVLAGLPGSGKTLLAQQYVFANATPEVRPSTSPPSPNRSTRSSGTARSSTSSTSARSRPPCSTPMPAPSSAAKACPAS